VNDKKTSNAVKLGAGLGCGALMMLGLCGVIGAIAGRPAPKTTEAAPEPVAAAPVAEHQAAVVRAPTPPAPAERQGAAPAATATATAPAVEYLKASCYEVAKKFGTSSTLTDLQKDNAWPSYDKHAFRWQLELVEVSQGLLGGFAVQWKCASRSDSLVSDLVMEYSDGAKATVARLQKGHVYEVDGKLTGTSTLLGLTADAL
jgi:hypothetical protein